MGAKNNERLEYLGDSVLGFVIAQKLYEMFPDASEGDLSRLRASLVNQTSLAELAREHKLGDYLILGSGELKSGGYRRDSILSDALEAIMGALVKDQGIEPCRDWVLGLFASKLAELDLKKVLLFILKYLLVYLSKVLFLTSLATELRTFCTAIGNATPPRISPETNPASTAPIPPGSPGTKTESRASVIAIIKYENPTDSPNANNTKYNLTISLNRINIVITPFHKINFKFRLF